MLYLTLIFLFLISAGLSHFYICYAWRHKLIDIPSARSSHTHLTPRGGGIVFLTLWMCSAVLAIFFHLWTLPQAAILLPGVLLVATVGFCDDRYHLSARWRALAYLIAAIFSVIALGGFSHFALSTNFIVPLGGLGSFLAVFAILWSVNLFNFMDGLDGVAATEAIFILSVGGFFMAQSGGYEIALLAWLLSACIAGFWIWNKPPAKIFMGDVGSATLGFIIMVLALWGEKQYGVPALLWFILYGVFLVDATLTVLRRLLAKEPIYQAHKLHAYQRLNQAGFSHQKVLIIISSVNVVLMSLAMCGFYYPDYLFGFALVALVMLLGLYSWIERIKRMYRSG